jgi:hypothetical protein
VFQVTKRGDSRTFSSLNVAVREETDVAGVETPDGCCWKERVLELEDAEEDEGIGDDVPLEERDRRSRAGWRFVMALLDDSADRALR